MDPGELARLEAHILDLLDRNQEIDPEELGRAFPGVSRTEIERVLASSQVVQGFLGELVGEAAVGGAEGARDWLEPGDRLGGYLVRGRLSGGGMGQVYLAVQESLEPRQVALKVHRLGRDREVDLRRARREAEIASRLVHPHLAAIHDMGSDLERGLVFFSMQFVDGIDLREHLRRESLAASATGVGHLGSPGPRRDRATLRRLVTRVSEVAGALAELHGRGYVHRDVKPENILLRSDAGRDGRTEAAVLVDFGLARAEQALLGDPEAGGERAPAGAGTPGYAPPESEGGGEVTPAWDVYSLGVLLYELLSARPLRRDGAGRPLRPTPAELEALPKISPAVGADLAAVVRKATGADPVQRYPDAGALQTDLEHWLSGELVGARRPPLPERLWRVARRSPRRTVLALLAVPLIASLTALGASVGDQVRQVRAGERALAQGELARGWSLLAGARPLFVRALLDGEDPVVRDVLDGTHLHPASRVAREHLERGPAAALQLAAAHLEQRGFRAGDERQLPRLQRFLLHNLGSSASAARRQTLHALSRLFYERPVLDPRDLPFVEPFRARLVELLGHPATGRDERHHALCALGGAGSLRELELLLDWLDPADGDGESIRLGIAACERILRRLRALGKLEDLSPEHWGDLEERLAALWGALGQRASQAGDPHGLAHHWAQLVRAWAFLQREGGRPLLRRQEFLAGLEDPLLRLRAALDGPSDSELHQRVLAIAANREGLSQEAVHRWWWGNWLGELCAFIGLEDLREAVGSKLRESPELVDVLEVFGEGWRSGRTQVERGPDPIFDPDDESRLRYLSAPPDSARSWGLLECASDLGGPRAAWSFGEVPARSGRAGDPLLGGGAYWLPTQDNPAHLRLPRAGSWVELPWTFGPEDQAQSWVLRIEHQSASRYPLPFHGQAWVRIELNGFLLAERLLTQYMGVSEAPFSLEGPFLAAGDHALRITLVEATTTYWLHTIRVGPRF